MDDSSKESLLSKDAPLAETTVSVNSEVRLMACRYLVRQR